MTVGRVVVSALLPQGDLLQWGVLPPKLRRASTVSVTQFTDVGAANYAARYILCMKTLELSRGFGGGAYGADTDLTRGQMASFLVRLWKDVLGNTMPPEGVRHHSLTSPPTVTTHQANIECLYNLGITKGVTATTYGPHPTTQSIPDQPVPPPHLPKNRPHLPHRPEATTSWTKPSTASQNSA